jgi:hypothetical protein
MASYYHLMLIVPGVTPTDPQIEDILNKAADWYRYADNCWLLYTSQNAATWYARLKPLVTQNRGNVFLVRVDPVERQGWMPKQLWEWLRKDRARSA